MRTRSDDEPESAEREPLRAGPDLRGTPVDDAEGRYTGKVYGTLADAGSGLIRYIDLELEGTDRHVLVPLGHAHIESDHDGPRVRLRAALRDELGEIPAYEPHAPADDARYQRALLAAHAGLFSGERYYAHPAYDHAGLYAGEHPIVRGPALRRSTRPLERLADLEGYRIAEDEPDIRDWPVRTADDATAGDIDDLIIDPDAGKVRYALVHLEPDDREVLVPVGFLTVFPGRQEVRTPTLERDDLRALPSYDYDTVSREDEDRIRLVLDERLDGPRRFDRPDFRS